MDDERRVEAGPDTSVPAEEQHSAEHPDASGAGGDKPRSRRKRRSASARRDPIPLPAEAPVRGADAESVGEVDAEVHPEADAALSSDVAVAAEHDPADPGPGVAAEAELDAAGDTDAPGAEAMDTEAPDTEAPDTEALDTEALVAQAAPLVEALLFASDGPVSAGKLADVVDIDGVTPGVVRKAIDVLNEKYSAAGLTFRVEPIARGYQMLTLPEFREVIGRLQKQRAEARLSDAALETLSIIAYKQPIIRADIEAIRGVSSGEMINRLRDLGLVKILGRAEVVGRPMMYGTTRKFLDIFGLADLDDLPPMESLKLQPQQSPTTNPGEEHHAAAGA